MWLTTCTDVYKRMSEESGHNATKAFDELKFMLWRCVVSSLQQIDLRCARKALTSRRSRQNPDYFRFPQSLSGRVPFLTTRLRTTRNRAFNLTLSPGHFCRHVFINTDHRTFLGTVGPQKQIPRRLSRRMTRWCRKTSA